MMRSDSGDLFLVCTIVDLDIIKGGLRIVRSAAVAGPTCEA